jgi:hypothetical protein
MSQLLDLPVELLHEITLYFNSDYKKWSSLSRLCRTCRKLRDIVQPILFHTLDLKRRYKEPTFTTQYLAITRAIIHRPTLAKSVRIVDICIGKRLILQNSDLAGFQITCLKDFTDITRWEPTLPWSDHWASKASVDVYPHVCMLLWFLRKLEVLRIHCDSSSPDMYHIANLVERLPNLREITTQFPGQHEVKVHWSELTTLLSLPRLRILKLKGLNLRDMTSKPCSLLPGSLGIEQLSLRQCTMRDSLMQQFITACKMLTHFTYTRLSEDRGEDPNPELWHTALSLHKGSLLALNLSFLDKHADEADNQPRPTWPSFGDFSSLKSLKVDYRRVQLFGLPKSLETLKLSDCWDFEPEDLDHLSAINKEWCPNIRNVEISVTEDCRYNRNVLKMYGFKWHDWSEKSMTLPTIDFLLMFILKEFTNGTIFWVSLENLWKQD